VNVELCGRPGDPFFFFLGDHGAAAQGRRRDRGGGGGVVHPHLFQILVFLLY